MKELNEEVRHLKQSYLREQIMEPGYDAGEFSEYIGKKKHQGSTDVIRH